MRLTLCFLFCCVTAHLHAQIPTNNLVAHWPFTGNVNDAHGTHHGNPNHIVPAQGKMGMNNTAYQFNHANAFIGVPYQSDMNMSAISMCAVLKPNGFYTNTCQGNYVLIRGAIGSSGGYFHGFSDNAYNDCNTSDTNQYVFSVHVGPIKMPNNAMQSSTKVRTGQWYCVVMTYNSGTTKIYVDGVLINTTSGWSPTIGTSTDSICIGKFPWGGTGFPYNFNGVLDDVALYNRELTQSELDSYCTNAPKAGIPVDTGDSNVTVKQINDIPNTIKLHPNPNNGNFTINGTLNSESAELILYNLVGTVMHKSIIPVKNTVISKYIDMGAVPGGIYLLKIKAGDYSENIRFVKQE